MRKTIKVHPCFYRKTRFFGDEYKHDWAYKNNKERECLVCGRQEIYFGNNRSGEEDWRKKLKK